MATSCQEKALQVAAMIVFSISCKQKFWFKNFREMTELIILFANVIQCAVTYDVTKKSHQQAMALHHSEMDHGSQTLLLFSAN